MKKIFTLFTIIMIAGIFSNTYAQQTCTPSHTGYTTVPTLGILLPAALDTATVGVPYVMSITIGVPDTASTYPVNWIQFNALQNHLSGNTWSIIDNTGSVPTTWPQWSPMTWQCATITGTPTAAGIDSVIIYVNANVSVFGFPYTATNTKAFSLPLVVVTATDVQNNAAGSTKLINSFPNPYQDYTQIGINGVKTDIATLNVYSSLGQLVYSEVKAIGPGQTYFNFTGASLASGTYFYSVKTSEKIFNDKLVKTR